MPVSSSVGWGWVCCAFPRMGSGPTSMCFSRTGSCSSREMGSLEFVLGDRFGPVLTLSVSPFGNGPLDCCPLISDGADAVSCSMLWPGGVGSSFALFAAFGTHCLVLREGLVGPFFDRRRVRCWPVCLDSSGGGGGAAAAAPSTTPCRQVKP